MNSRYESVNDEPSISLPMESRHGSPDVSDNRLENLSYGTKKENSADKHAQGTAVVGERNGVGNLTVADVLEIRAAKLAGVPSRIVAQQKGISAGGVRMIWTRRTWRHV